MKTFNEYISRGGDKTSGHDRKLDKAVSDEIKKRKLAKFPVNTTDDFEMIRKPNKPAFTFPSPNSDMMIQVFLKKMLPSKGQPKGMMAFNYQFEDK